jgi:hypothetical protein
VNLFQKIIQTFANLGFFALVIVSFAVGAWLYTIKPEYTLYFGAAILTLIVFGAVKSWTFALLSGFALLSFLLPGVLVCGAAILFGVLVLVGAVNNASHPTSQGGVYPPLSREERGEK